MFCASMSRTKLLQPVTALCPRLEKALNGLRVEPEKIGRCQHVESDALPEIGHLALVIAQIRGLRHGVLQAVRQQQVVFFEQIPGRPVGPGGIGKTLVIGGCAAPGPLHSAQHAPSAVAVDFQQIRRQAGRKTP
jgi:hypothetical protein